MIDITIGDLIEYCSPAEPPAKKPKAKPLVYFNGRIGRANVSDGNTTVAILEALGIAERLGASKYEPERLYQKRQADALRLCLEIHKL